MCTDGHLIPDIHGALFLARVQFPTCNQTLVLTNINNYLTPLIIIIECLSKYKTLRGEGILPERPPWIRP